MDRSTTMSPLRSLPPCLLTLLFLHVNYIQAIPTHGKVVTCYIGTWAKYRPDGGKFVIDNLKPEHCTHLIYAFAGLNPISWEIQSLDRWADLEEGGIGNYKRMTSLRKNYPGLKVSIAIGGWNEGSGNYSTLAADPSKRKTFIVSVIRFLKEHGFNGLDLDWEFPGQRGGVPEDKKNFALLVEELWNDLSKNGYILTAAISANKRTIDEAYDIPKISKYLNYIHVMTYDYHGAWEASALPNAPLYSTDDSNIDSTMRYLLNLGAPPDKLVLGLPMYGRVYLLTKSVSPGKSPIGMPTQDKSFSGPYTREDGFMGFNEICEEMASNSWISGWDNVTRTPYAVNETRVICYDDDKSLYEKVLYANKQNLAGVMIWSIDTDDFKGRCGIEYKLMTSINEALKSNEIVTTKKRPDIDNEIVSTTKRPDIDNEIVSTTKRPDIDNEIVSTTKRPNAGTSLHTPYNVQIIFCATFISIFTLVKF